MTSPSGTYYYPPCAGTGNLLLSNPPFIMATQQPTPEPPAIPNRDHQHGGLEAVGNIGQGIKIFIRTGRNWPRLTPGEQEALDMIAHKVARILSGDDPHDPEHWRDVAGYAVAARRVDKAEAEQPVNRWRCDRLPRFKNEADENGYVWGWSATLGMPVKAPVILLEPDNIPYWAPGNLPAPPHPPQP